MSDHEPHFSPCHTSPLSDSTCQCCSDHRRTISLLIADLEAERAAAATAAAEAMAMILRLQREKSDAMLEARQIRRLAEEQIGRCQEEIQMLEEVLMEKEDTILSLSTEIQDCNKVFDDLPQWVNHTLDDNTIMEKRVVRQSPNSNSPKHLKRLSSNSSGSTLDFDKYNDNDNDDISTLSCLMDPVHGTPNCDECMDKPTFMSGRVEEEEINELCERVKALEADRESLKEIIDSVDKQKGVLLKEIKQKLSKETVVQKKKVVKRRGFFKRFSVISMLKLSLRWLTSAFFGRKKPPRVRYSFNQSSKYLGLLVFLHTSPGAKQRKCLVSRDQKLGLIKPVLCGT
ncbi:hypothetical protein LUZ60_004665 [Juncus effusus]|nr:hypothetical protein LUZ60_004665 [Juncus effusus]